MGASIGERLDQVGVVLAGSLTTIGVVLLAAHSLSDPNVTWDEAGQYWMTQGHAFGSSLGAPAGKGRARPRQQSRRSRACAAAARGTPWAAPAACAADRPAHFAWQSYYMDFVRIPGQQLH